MRFREEGIQRGSSLNQHKERRFKEERIQRGLGRGRGGRKGGLGERDPRMAWGVATRQERRFREEGIQRGYYW